MIHITYNPSDRRYIFLYGDIKELRQVEEHLNKIPQYMFLPSFSGIPKPEVFLNRMTTKSGQIVFYCYAGLWKEISDFCKKNNIEHDDLDGNFKYTEFNMTLEQFTDYVKSWHLNIDLRPYQYKAAWLILKYRLSMSQLATRAGKTLIAYVIFRYMLEHGAHNILMIVPNVTLVKQGVKDMAEYQEFFQSETVWADGELCDSSNLTIGTFQSLVKRASKGKRGKINNKFNPKFFDKFDVICCDEAHTAKCDSIKSILNLPFTKNVKLRFGFSGSLPIENTIESFACQSLLGPCIQDIRSKELIDEGYLAEPHIHQIRINYPESEQLIETYIRCGEYLNSNDKKENGKTLLLPKEQRAFTMTHQKVLPVALAQLKNLYEPREYMMYLIDLCKAKGANLLMLEQMLVHLSKKRLRVMDDILKTIDKNTIVFCHHTEYLRFLEKHFKEVFPDRNVYAISGSTSTKKRDEIIKNLNDDKGAILVASYGCLSTGVTLKNIDYGIFAQSFKSQIINKQSLGRGLLKTDNKDTFELYDIIDHFPTEKLYQQGIAKIKLYKQEQMKFDITDI